MSFAAGEPRIWPIPPDWTNSVDESLAWATDVMQASATAVTWHRGLRDAPRRSLSFEILVASKEHRASNMLLAGHSGAWELPFWPDVQWLGDTVEVGAEEIPCATAGFDFVVGGRALLYASVNRWELVDVDAIEAGHIALSTPVSSEFGRGSRLYPVRRARLQPGAEERLRNLDTGRRRLAFDFDEPCDWPLLASPVEYLGHLVLDVRPDDGNDPSSRYDRLLKLVDYGTSQPFIYDLPDVALRLQQSQWKLYGRAQHSWFRSLLYTLDGRRVPIWIPSFSSCLQPTATIAGGSQLLVVEWAGYTQFGLDRPNRKDVRVELVDGTIHYRRIEAAAEAGENEHLAIDAPLDGAGIAPEAIRSVSFMALSTLASDEIEIEHVTDQDGLARSTTGWQAVVPDV